MSQLKKVTDPKLLKQLEVRRVKDPALLSQLNEEDEGAFLDSLPEQPGFFSKLPRNIAIGLAHAGRNLHNLPHDLTEALETKTKDIGSLFNSLHPQEHVKQRRDISSFLPNDTLNYAETFGQKGEGTLLDNILQKGIEHSPEIIGGAGLLRSGFRRLKGTHQLDQVQRSIARSGLNDFSYTPELIEEAQRFLPRSHATREAINNSNAGNYRASFGIQSDVGRHQRNLANSALASERLLAPRAGEIKQQMLRELGEVMRTNGLEEDADLLATGINNFRQYTRVKNAVIPVLKKLGIPTSILAAIGLGVTATKYAKRKFID